MAGPSHTFAQLAEAIDVAFARWDLSHLHMFELPDGRRVGFADIDQEEHGWLDHDAPKVARELAPGEEFKYTFCAKRNLEWNLGGLPRPRRSQTRRY